MSECLSVELEVARYVRFQECLEIALDAYCSDLHPYQGQLRYWQAFNIEDWHSDGAVLEVFWATPSYSGHPSENGTISLPLADLMPYIEAELEVSQ